MITSLTIGAAVYYFIGFAWLLSGWLRWRGDRTGVLLWIIAYSAIWPWLLLKLYDDVRNGRNETHFDG